MINITFPDNSVKEFEAGVTPLQIAQSISPRLAREVLAASVNGQEWDLTRPITEDAEIKLFKWEDAEGKHAFWHSSAHLLAEALQQRSEELANRSPGSLIMARAMAARWASPPDA